MSVNLEEMKNYLRVDFDDDNNLITSLIYFSEKQIKAVLRIEDDEFIEKYEEYKPAIFYSVAYLYEHREDANHNDLNLTLRAMLFSDRKVGF